MNRRILYNRASADPDGKPWSERKSYVWWDADARRVDRATTSPTSRPTSAPDYVPPEGAEAEMALRGDEPFVMQADGKGWLFVPERPGRRPAADALRAARVAGRATRSTASRRTPRASTFERRDNPLQPDRRRARRRRLPVRVDDLPAHRAPHRRRHVALPALPVRAAAGDVLRGLPRARRRARARARRLGDDRHRARPRSRRACWSPSGCARCASQGRTLHQVGLPYHWGSDGLATRRLGQRPAADRRSTPTCTSRRSRRRPATSGPAAARAGRRCSRSSTTTGGRAGHERRRATPPGRHLRRRGAAARRASSPTRRVCIGCKACEVACKEWNGVPEDGLELHRRCPTTTPARWAPTPGATSRSSSSSGAAASVPERRGSAGDGERDALADVLRRLQALHPRRLPRGLPDRRAVPHRVRHRRRAGGHLQRLRLLRPRLPVRRARPARGRRPGLEVHALLRPPAATAWSRPAPRPARPTRSSSARSTSCASAPRDRVDDAARARASTARSSTATTRTTASAAPARSSCCSTSPRSTGCRPTRSTTTRDLRRRCGGRRASPRRRSPPARRRRARWAGGDEPRRERSDGAAAPSRAPTTAARSSSAPVWKPEIPWYFFAGGLAGASAPLALAAAPARQRAARAPRRGGRAAPARPPARRC